MKDAISFSQNKVFYENSTSRKLFPVVQPPLYLYLVHFSGSIYFYLKRYFNPNRLFNIVLNVFPILFFFFTFLSIHFFALRNPNFSKLNLPLLFWLNPVLILNSPIQGYFDPLIIFFSTLVSISIYEKKMFQSFIWLTLGILSKPTIVIILPVMVFLTIVEVGFFKLIKYAIFCFSMAIFFCLPFIATNQLLSVILGVASITQTSVDLSRQALNLWWPIQFFTNSYISFTEKGCSFFSSFLGGRCANWEADITQSFFVQLTNFNVSVASNLFFLLLTCFNLFFLNSNIKKNRTFVFLHLGLQAYIYFISRVGVQGNHYIILIPLLTIFFSTTSLSVFRYILFICTIFFIQDFLFYGLGRDFNIGVRVLSNLNIGIITVLLSFFNIYIFLKIIKLNFRSLKQ